MTLAINNNKIAAVLMQPSTIYLKMCTVHLLAYFIMYMVYFSHIVF